MDNIKKDPEFQKTFNKLESKFWDNHKKIKKSLKQKKLI